MKKRQNKTIIIFFLVLPALIILFEGYAVFSKLFNDKTEEIEITETIDNKEVTKEKLSEMVLENLYVLWNKTTLDELTNQEKLEIIFN